MEENPLISLLESYIYGSDEEKEKMLNLTHSRHIK